MGLSLSLAVKEEAMISQNPVWKPFLRLPAETLLSILTGCNEQTQTICILSLLSCQVAASLLVRPLRFLLCIFWLNSLKVYYNEARILDQTTFQTITQLPNLPGAVNNCK